MNLAGLIPTLDDDALASLKANAVRIEGGPEGARQKAARELIPLIDAELAERKARRPAPAGPAARKRKVAAAK